MQEVVALDTIFSGDVAAVTGTLKLLAGIGQRVRLEVQRDAEYRKVQEAQVELAAAQQKAQAEIKQAQDAAQAKQQAAQQAAAQLQAQIDAINAALPDLLK